MKFLNLKLLRDLKKNWRQFFSVFLMALLSVLVFVGLQGAWHGLEVSLDKYIKFANLPTVWVQGSRLTDEEIKEIKDLSSVNELNTKTRILSSIANNNDKSSEQYLILDTLNDNSEKSINTIKGKEVDYSNSGKQEIWVNSEYAAANNLSEGDDIKITILNKEVSLEIVGLVQSAERIYFAGNLEYIAPNYKDYAYGYVTEETLKNITGTPLSPNLLEIYSKENDIRDDIEDILGDKLISYYNQQTLTDVSEATDRVGQIRNLSYLFSFIFILLAILAMFSTIRRLIESRTKEIAVIKALGYSNTKVSLHYISFGLLVSVLGVAGGTLISPIMSTFVLGTQKRMFSLPKWQIAYSTSSLVVIGLVILVCIISAYLAARQAINGLPAVFLRGKDKDVKHIFLEKISNIWSKVSYESKWAIRDAFINRVRVLMGIIGVAGSMMLLIAGVGMPISMNHLVDKAYNEDFSYEQRLNVADYELAQKTYGGQGVQINQAHFSKDDGYNRLLIVISDGDFVKPSIDNGATIEEGGLYVTRGFAKLANIEVGDKIGVKPYLDGKSFDFEVKGIVTSETNQGAYIMEKTFTDAGGIFRPQTLLVGKDVSDSKTATDENVLSVIKKSDQENNAYEFVQSLMNVFMMIIGFALLLVVVVLYNLGSLNFVERTRDYATLQVLGFSKKKLQNLTMLENLMTTSIGWLLGIPMGVWFLGQYVATFSTIRIEYIAHINWIVITVSSLLVWFTSLFTTYLISRRIRNIDMVEALKGVE